jgi:hypothetical protein
VINVEKNGAYSKAIADLKASGMLAEAVERKTWSTISIPLSSKITALSTGESNQGWASFPLRRQGERCKALCTMQMIRKGQVRGVNKGDVTGRVAFIASLFEVAA